VKDQTPALGFEIHCSYKGQDEVVSVILSWGNAFKSMEEILSLRSSGDCIRERRTGQISIE